MSNTASSVLTWGVQKRPPRSKFFAQNLGPFGGHPQCPPPFNTSAHWPDVRHSPCTLLETRSRGMLGRFPRDLNGHRCNGNSTTQTVRARTDISHHLEPTQKPYHSRSTGHNMASLPAAPTRHRKICNVLQEFSWLPSDCYSQ